MRLPLFLCVLFYVSIEPSFSQYDYSKLESWKVHPNGLYDAHLKSEDEPKADVFYLHPTTYYRAVPKNQNKQTPVTNRRLDRIVINQVSSFASSARIFLPVYRQAHLRVFLKGDTNHLRCTLDTAYADIREAFQTYMANWNQGRPIVIASHSQGSFLALRLLKEFFDGENRNKLVAAYVIGIPVSQEHLRQFDRLKYCENMDDYGCMVSWMTIDDKSGITEPRTRARALIGSEFIPSSELELVCTNPLTWGTTSELAMGKELHALIPAARYQTMRWTKKPIKAEIDGGFVRVSGHDKTVFNGTNGNLHVYDYNLFYRDIEKNLRNRINKFAKNGL